MLLKNYFLYISITWKYKKKIIEITFKYKWQERKDGTLNIVIFTLMIKLRIR